MFLVEPVQGKGVHLPPGRLPRGRRRSSAAATARSSASTRCRPGFGRTGKLFAFEHWGLEPDLVPVAKSLSGGYVPVGALLMSKAVHEARVRLDGERVQPRLDVRAERARDGRRARDAARARRAGPRRARRRRSARRLLELTEPLVERHDVVREVRGLGLMWAIEFGEPASRPRSYRLVERLQHGLFAQLVVVPLFRDHHVLSQVAGHGIPVIKGLPPLVVTEDDLASFAEALDATIGKAPQAAAGDGRVRADRRGHPLTQRPCCCGSARRSSPLAAGVAGDRDRGRAAPLGARARLGSAAGTTVPRAARPRPRSRAGGSRRRPRRASRRRRRGARPGAGGRLAGARARDRPRRRRPRSCASPCWAATAPARPGSTSRSPPAGRRRCCRPAAPAATRPRSRARRSPAASRSASAPRRYALRASRRRSACRTARRSLRTPAPSGGR